MCRWAEISNILIFLATTSVKGAPISSFIKISIL